MIGIEKVLHDALVDLVGTSETKELKIMKKCVHDGGGDPEDVRIVINSINTLLAYNNFYGYEIQ